MFFVNAFADLWNRPSLILQDHAPGIRKTSTGNVYSFSGVLGIKRFGTVSVYVQPGYKTDGFVQGETLANGFFLQTGLGVSDL